MTRREAIKVVSETLVNVLAGQAVWVEEDSPLYNAMLLLTEEDATEFTRRHKRDEKVWKQRGYHGSDGWPIPVRPAHAPGEE